MKEMDNSFGRWGWFALVEKLAKGDITKFEDIYKENWIAALNLLSYWKEKETYQARLQKQQTKQYN
jgi:hypothetical protein